MEDTHEAVLRWPRTDANDVIVSGDFDQWSNSIHLTKDASGFETKVRIPWGTKVEYKFLVDGVWRTRDDMPIERDPSGKYINNAYTAPPKPASTVSSAIAYVASGIGGALSTIAGIDSGKALAESSTKDVAPNGIIVKSDPSLTTPLAKVDAAPAISKQPEKVVPITTSSSGRVVPPATSGLEASTHAPIVLRKPGVSDISSKEGAQSPLAPPSPPAPTPAPASTPAPAPAPARAPTTPLPATPSAAIVKSKPEAPADITKSSEPAAVPEVDKKLNTNGAPDPQPSHSPAHTSISRTKHHFPGSHTDGDVSSSGSTKRKKRHSLFSRTSDVTDGDSTIVNGKRKKKLSFFGKIKHLFEHHKD